MNLRCSCTYCFFFCFFFFVVVFFLFFFLIVVFLLCKCLCIMCVVYSPLLGGNKESIFCSYFYSFYGIFYALVALIN